jgi:large subunit ribosomal protein L7/L12
MAKKLTKEEIIEALKEYTILELNDLVHGVEEAFGVTAAVVSAGPAAVVEEAAGPVVPTTGTVVLKNVGQAKIAVVKAVQKALNIGLMDANNLLKTLPVELKKDIPLSEADEIKAALVEAGAEVEIK